MYINITYTYIYLINYRSNKLFMKYIIIILTNYTEQRFVLLQFNINTKYIKN